MASPKKKRTKQQSAFAQKLGTGPTVSPSTASHLKLRVEVKPRAGEVLNELSPEERAELVSMLKEIPAAFGRPHVHGGIGVRQLRPGLYEARHGLLLRAVFVRESDALVVTFIGTHDGVRRYMRENP